MVMPARLVCMAAVAMCLLAATAWAQTGLRSASLPDRTPMEPIPPPRADQFLATPRTYAPRFERSDPREHHRQDRPRRWRFAGDVFVPSAPWAFGAYPDPGAAEVESVGYLHLDVQPLGAEVHVNGFYMGTAADFRRVIPGRPLEAGPHRVELRAPGYEPVTFDVRILPNETVTYRRELDASREPAVAAPPPLPKTFYVIPGCYAGDRHPRTVPLPSGCEISNLRTIPPVVSSASRR